MRYEKNGTCTVAYSYIDIDTIKIDSIYVANSDRNKGLGTKFLGDFLRKFKNYNIVGYGVSRALNFYKNLGFKIKSVKGENHIFTFHHQKKEIK